MPHLNIILSCAVSVAWPWPIVTKDGLLSGILPTHQTSLSGVEEYSEKSENCQQNHHFFLKRTSGSFWQGVEFIFALNTWLKSFLLIKFANIDLKIRKSIFLQEKLNITIC